MTGRLPSNSISPWEKDIVMTVKQELVEFAQWLERETRRTRSQDIYSLIQSLGTFQQQLSKLGTEEEIQQIVSNSNWEY